MTPEILATHHTTHYIFYITHYILHTTHFTLHTTHCTLHTSQLPLLAGSDNRSSLTPRGSMCRPRPATPGSYAPFYTPMYAIVCFCALVCCYVWYCMLCPCMLVCIVLCASPCYVLVCWRAVYCMPATGLYTAGQWALYGSIYSRHIILPSNVNARGETVGICRSRFEFWLFLRQETFGKQFNWNYGGDLHLCQPRH